VTNGDESATEADRSEQREPGAADPRRGHRHPLDEPEADVLEQELPAADGGDAPTGLDADRVEPVDDDERPAG
jgi:hypothetical protein